LSPGGTAAAHALVHRQAQGHSSTGYLKGIRVVSRGMPGTSEDARSVMVVGAEPAGIGSSLQPIPSGASSRATASSLMLMARSKDPDPPKDPECPFSLNSSIRSYRARAILCSSFSRPRDSRSPRIDLGRRRWGLCPPQDPGCAPLFPRHSCPAPCNTSTSRSAGMPSEIALD